MKALTTAAVAAALVLANCPRRCASRKTCDTVMKSLSDALQVGLKSYQATVEECKAKPVAKNKLLQRDRRVRRDVARLSGGGCRMPERR